MNKYIILTDNKAVIVYRGSWWPEPGDLIEAKGGALYKAARVVTAYGTEMEMLPMLLTLAGQSAPIESEAYYRRYDEKEDKDGAEVQNPES